MSHSKVEGLLSSKLCSNKYSVERIWKKSIWNFRGFSLSNFATELAWKGLILGIFPFLGANIQDGILFIKHDYCTIVFPFNVLCHHVFLFNSDLVLSIVLKYMFKEKRRVIKHWRGNLTKKNYIYTNRRGR